MTATDLAATSPRFPPNFNVGFGWGALFEKGISMSVLRTVTTAGLIALTLGSAASVTTTTAAASERGAFFGGLAAGVVGGALVAGAARPAYPVYPAYPTYYRSYPAYYDGPVYERVYVRPYHGCYWAWRHNRWGEPYRVELCR